MELARNNSLKGNNKNMSKLKLISVQKKRFVVSPIKPDYYQCLPIQPGLGFFKALTESKHPISSLKINIPAILIDLGTTVLLKTSILKAKQATMVPYKLQKE